MIKRILIGSLLGILTGVFLFLATWETINLTLGSIRGVYIGWYYAIIFGAICGLLTALLTRLDFKKTIKTLGLIIVCGLLGLAISMTISRWLYDKYEKDKQTYIDTFGTVAKGQPAGAISVTITGTLLGLLTGALLGTRIKEKNKRTAANNS